MCFTNLWPVSTTLFVISCFVSFFSCRLASWLSALSVLWSVTEVSPVFFLLFLLKERVGGWKMNARVFIKVTPKTLPLIPSAIIFLNCLHCLDLYVHPRTKKFGMFSFWVKFGKGRIKCTSKGDVVQFRVILKVHGKLSVEFVWVLQIQWICQVQGVLWL